MAADSVTGAVVAKLDAHTTLAAALTGGIWHRKIPEDYPLPFASVQYLGAPDGLSGLSTGAEYVENARVQVWVFDKDDAVAEEYAEWVDEALDQKPLSFTGTSVHLATLKVEPELDQEEFKAPDGNTVFRAVRQYLCMVQRTRR